MNAAVWGGLLVGLSFGVVARISKFCLVRGLRESRSGQDGRPLRTFALAIAVAILGSQALQWAGLVDLSESVYVRPSFSLLGVLLGGALFGVGMVLARSCGARALVLLGGGNLRSFVVLLCLGLAGYATLNGLLSPVRLAVGSVSMVSLEQGVSLPAWLASVGLPPALATWGAALAVAVPLLVYALRHAPLRRTPTQLWGGVAVGAVVVLGWYVTGVAAADDFDPIPLSSLSFIVPLGEALLYTMVSSGMTLGFTVSMVAGVVLGALLVALASGGFQLEGFEDGRQMLRYMAGGALMGFGGVLAVGCSVGQGITGLSTLAVMSFVALAGILAGALVSLRYCDARPAGAQLVAPSRSLSTTLT